MSAKPCNRCGQIIVFGKDQDTGMVLPLSVGERVYRVVKENIVARDSKALVRHVCSVTPPPIVEKNFTEPKESDA